MAKFDLNKTKGSKSINKAKENVAKVEHVTATVLEIPVDKINPSEKNFYSMSDIEDITASIREFGILQPLMLSRLTNGNYEIIAGHRRFTGAQNVGLEKVPAIVKEDVNELDFRLLLVHANKHREKSISEKTREVAELKELYELKKENGEKVGNVNKAIAKTLDMSVDAVKRSSRLNNLIPLIQKLVEDGELNASTADQFATLPKEVQHEIYENVLYKGKVSREEARKLKQDYQEREKVLKLKYEETDELKKELDDKKSELAKSENELIKYKASEEKRIAERLEEEKKAIQEKSKDEIDKLKEDIKDSNELKLKIKAVEQEKEKAIEDAQTKADEEVKKQVQAFKTEQAKQVENLMQDKKQLEEQVQKLQDKQNKAKAKDKADKEKYVEKVKVGVSLGECSKKMSDVYSTLDEIALTIKDLNIEVDNDLKQTVDLINNSLKEITKLTKKIK